MGDGAWRNTRELRIKKRGPWYDDAGIGKYDCAMIKTVTFLMMFLLIAGCQGTLHQKRPSRGDQAEIYLYIQPLPPGAGEPGLHITISVESGRSVPTVLVIHSV